MASAHILFLSGRKLDEHKIMWTTDKNRKIKSMLSS